MADVLRALKHMLERTTTALVDGVARLRAERTSGTAGEIRSGLGALQNQDRASFDSSTPHTGPSVGMSPAGGQASSEATGRHAPSPQHGFSQQEIYDIRYQQEGYDNRSAVHVLTAEMSAIRGAVDRAAVSNPEADVISLFDFGYGTGRVTRDFALSHPALPGNRKDLLVLAYDVAGMGLAKSAATIKDLHGFRGSVSLRNKTPSGYIMGDLTRNIDGVNVTFRFIHGNENDPLEAVHRLITEANDGGPVTVTSSWYGSVSHTPGVLERARLFETLGSLTHPRGEMVISVSSTGDLVEDQQHWLEKLRNDDVAGLPIEVPGDVVYETEIPGLSNFYHLFDTDLDESMKLTLTDKDQRYWVEGIRFPDPEFENREAEQENYRKVVEFNEQKAGSLWTPADYAQLHTVAGFRSASVQEP